MHFLAIQDVFISDLIIIQLLVYLPMPTNYPPNIISVSHDMIVILIQSLVDTDLVSQDFWNKKPCSKSKIMGVCLKRFLKFMALV